MTTSRGLWAALFALALAVPACTSTDASRPAAITSDAIDWRAATDEHPARMASMRSYSAVAKGDLAEWLTVYAEDAVLEDPVGGPADRRAAPDLEPHVVVPERAEGPGDVVGRLVRERVAGDEHGWSRGRCGVGLRAGGPDAHGQRCQHGHECCPGQAEDHQPSTASRPSIRRATSSAEV